MYLLFAAIASLFLLPAGLVILVWFVLGFRFKWILEGFIVAIVNAFSAVAWTIYANEYVNSYSAYGIYYKDSFILLENLTVESFGNELFSERGLIGLISGLLIYLGVRLWNTHRLGAILLFLVGWALFLAYAMFFLVMSFFINSL